MRKQGREFDLRLTEGIRFEGECPSDAKFPVLALPRGFRGVKARGTRLSGRDVPVKDDGVDNALQFVSESREL